MFNKKFFITILSVLLYLNICGVVNSAEVNTIKLPAQTTQNATSTINESLYKEVQPTTLVSNASKYFNKKVKINATFDKFSVLGLDYPPVKRDAKTYISFLVKRENVTSYNIPLSELKLIVSRNYAEKELVNIEQGDSITIYGNVFSLALGDPWVDVEKVIINTNKKQTTENKGK